VKGFAVVACSLAYLAVAAVIAASSSARIASDPPLTISGDSSLNSALTFNPYDRCDTAGCVLYPKLQRTGFPKFVSWYVTPVVPVRLEQRVADPTGAIFDEYAQTVSTPGRVEVLWAGEPSANATSPNYAKPGIYRTTTTMTSLTDPSRTLSVAFTIVVKKPPPAQGTTPPPSTQLSLFHHYGVTCVRKNGFVSCVPGHYPAYGFVMNPSRIVVVHQTSKTAVTAAFTRMQPPGIAKPTPAGGPPHFTYNGTYCKADPVSQGVQCLPTTLKGYGIEINGGFIAMDVISTGKLVFKHLQN
jgi:hypothetical protein